MKSKILVFITLLIFLIPNVVLANTTDSGVVPYSVQANLPENQINDNVSYFDIEMEPGESQDLEVTVYNSSNEELEVNVNNTIASTNSNGIITYDGLEEGEEVHESMKNKFTDISSLDESTVKIPAGEQKVVSLEVNAPDESFDGVILGGLYFTLDPRESDESEGVAIQNRYAYALAVQIREEGNENVVEPDLELIDVEPGAINYRTGLSTTFGNLSPKIINTSFEGSVYREGEDEPLYQNMIEEFIIAPNAQFNFNVMYDNHALEPGDYVFKANVKSEDGEWNFEEEFEVTEEVADEANEEAVELIEEEDNNLEIILIIIGAAILIILIVILLLMVRKRK